MAKNEKKNATPITTPAPAATTIGVDQTLVESLMAALIAERNGNKRPAPDETLHEVTNVGGCAVTFQITDSRTGLSRNIMLDRRGAKAKVTEEQIAEIREKSPHFFAEGYLSTSLIEDTPNTIPDLAAFLATLSIEDVNTRIEQISSVGTLYALYNHIENQRFIHEDEKGQPFTEKGQYGKDILVVKEKAIEAKLVAVEMAVQRRLTVLAGVRVSLDA